MRGDFYFITTDAHFVVSKDCNSDGIAAFANIGITDAKIYNNKIQLTNLYLYSKIPPWNNMC